MINEKTKDALAGKEIEKRGITTISCRVLTIPHRSYNDVDITRFNIKLPYIAPSRDVPIVSATFNNHSR